MNTFQELENLLIDSISGDNEKMQASLNIFNEAAKEPEKLIDVFTSLISNSTNSEAVKAAMIIFVKLLQNVFSEISDESREKVVDFIVHYKEKVDRTNLKLFTHIVQVVEFYYYKNPEMNLKLLLLFHETDLETRFLIEIIISFNGMNGIAEITKDIEYVLKVTLDALHDPDVYYQACGIRAVTILFSLYPDQYPALQNHINKILEIAKESPKLPDSDFKIVWRNIGELLQKIDPDYEFPMGQFVDLIFAATERKDICPEDRLCPLLSFRKNLEYLDKEIVRKIALQSIAIAIDYVNSVHQLPTSFLFFYDSIFNIFPHSYIYNYVSKIVNDLITSGDFAKQIVALCLIKSLVEFLPHYVFNDIKLVNFVTEGALKSEDWLFICAGCQIVASFHVFFMWNLVDPELFINLTIPLMVHPHPDVRECAYLATTKIYDISLIPFKCSLIQILSQAEKIHEEDFLRYLHFIALVIKKQSYISDEELATIREFTMKLFDTSNEVALCGGLTILTRLMASNESDAKDPVIIEKVVTTLQKLFQSDNVLVVYHGIRELAKWIQISHDFTLLEQNTGKIDEILNLDISSEALIKSLTLQKVASIDFMTPNHPFIEKLLNAALPFIESDSTLFVLTAIKVLQKVALSLAPEAASPVFNAIAKACIDTKSSFVAEKCYKVMSYILKYASPETRSAIKPAAIHMCEVYFKGELHVLDGVPPLSSDSQIPLMFSSMSLFIETFDERYEAHNFMFNELFSIYKKGNILQNELIIYVSSFAIEKNILTEPEKIYLKKRAISLLKENLHIVLLMSESMLLTSLITKGLIEWDIISSHFNIFVSWWNRCHSEKHKMRATFTTLAILIWTIASYYKTTDIPILEDSLEEFPPSNMLKISSAIDLITSTIDGNFNNISDNLKKLASISILRIFSRPLSELHRNDVSENQLVKLDSLINRLRNKNKVIQDAINEFISKSNGNPAILKYSM